MPDGDRKTAEPAAFPNEVGCSKSSEHGQGPKRSLQAPRDFGKRELRLLQQELARLRIAAVSRTVGERPAGPGGLGVPCFSVQQPRADTEEDPAAKGQSFGLGLAPRKWFQHGLPGILKFRQLFPGHASWQQ